MLNPPSLLSYSVEIQQKTGDLLVTLWIIEVHTSFDAVS